ncbi:phist protein (Pf-fam-b) [Plasmodium vivax Mauritania I]|uniref:Phist protein (Pf-fam-b) n=1 Tax=Plasmodium vivax Mauritania I TaxID=1035515 RepID=A0A0J9TH89_PLAVI|nr:phist protein (Pf-fam-b) [Plasmodium vivax Mauritania I]
MVNSNKTTLALAGKSKSANKNNSQSYLADDSDRLKNKSNGKNGRNFGAPRFMNAVLLVILYVVLKNEYTYENEAELMTSGPRQLSEMKFFSKGSKSKKSSRNDRSEYPDEQFNNARDGGHSRGRDPRGQMPPNEEWDGERGPSNSRNRDMNAGMQRDGEHDRRRGDRRRDRGNMERDGRRRGRNRGGDPEEEMEMERGDRRRGRNRGGDADEEMEMERGDRRRGRNRDADEEEDRDRRRGKGRDTDMERDGDRRRGKGRDTDMERDGDRDMEKGRKKGPNADMENAMNKGPNANKNTPPGAEAKPVDTTNLADIKFNVTEAEIAQMIDKLEDYVKFDDMFLLFNYVNNNEKMKYIRMQLGVVRLCESLAQSYKIPHYYKTRQWSKSYQGMSDQLLHNERKAYNKLCTFLQNGNSSHIAFVEFLNELIGIWTSFTKEMEKYWKEYLSNKLKVYWETTNVEM